MSYLNGLGAILLVLSAIAAAPLTMGVLTGWVAAESYHYFLGVALGSGLVYFVTRPHVVWRSRQPRTKAPAGGGG